MKKIILTSLALIVLSGQAFADCLSEAQTFFNSYVTAANTYDPTVVDMYSPTAKIIRQVVLPDNAGTKDVDTDMDTYIKQMKLSQGVAKLRHYTNTYTDVTYTEIGDCKYKISMNRTPKGEDYKLKCYQIVQKQSDGKWLITEEMMQTKEQILLKYAK